MTSKTLIILGHGSRREAANAEIRLLGEMVKAQNPAWQVEVAFVEFAVPSLEDKVRELAEKNIREIILAPVFLTVGNHLAQGLPKRLQALAEEWAGLKLIMADHLGADPLIASLISKRAREAFQSLIDGDRKENGI